MPECNRECKLKVHRARNVDFTNQFPVQGEGENCPRLNGTQAVLRALKKTVEDAVGSRATPIEGHLCAEGCTCDIVGEPRWGRRWVQYTFTATLVVRNCKYSLTGTYEKNAGIADGVCIDPDGGEDELGEISEGTKGGKSEKGKKSKSRR